NVNPIIVVLQNSSRLRGFDQGLAAKPPSHPSNYHPAHGEYLMFPAVSQLVPLAVKSCRQIIPPVIATLIAAGLISAYNRAFSTHVQQPRMSALHEVAAADGTTAPITTVGMTKPPALPAPPVTETITIYEEVAAPERLAEKEAGEESGKDQSPVRLAAEPPPAPAPVRAASPPARGEPKAEPRGE